MFRAFLSHKSWKHNQEHLGVGSALARKLNYFIKGCTLKLKLLLHFGVLDCLSFSGAAAQEIVKLVTRQFVPFNNTYIYNGITGSSSTLQLWFFYFHGQTSSYNIECNLEIKNTNSRGIFLHPERREVNLIIDLVVCSSAANMVFFLPRHQWFVLDLCK